YMAFHGGLCYTEYTGDLLVALSVRHQRKDLALSRTQLRIGSAIGQAAHDRRGQESRSRMHAPQSLYKGFVGHALDDVPKRAGSHRLMNIFIPFVGSENQALCVRILLPDSAQGIKPAHSRQSQVHQGDVGMMLL